MAPPRAQLLLGGAKLTDWILEGGPATRRAPLLNARLRWNAFWFDRNLAFNNTRLNVAELPGDPVFIVGMWRTGSSLLHTRLCEQAQWSTPLTWQCFNPSSLLLGSPSRERSVRRPMDEGVITTFSPQEDEFASLLLGEDSLYRIFIDPRRADTQSALLERWLQPAPGKAALTLRWDDFLRGVLTLAPGRLLLKSPNHTFRLPWLAARFPNARFIWLTRKSEGLIESNYKMWLAMANSYALWDTDHSAIDRMIRKAAKIHDDVADWARGALAGRIEWLRFEDIVRDPANVAQRLMTVLAS